MIDFSTEGLYKSLVNRPHVVVLGAGATVATIPNGDKYGNKSPIMKNFIRDMNLVDIISKMNLKTDSDNFEDIYSEMDERDDCALLKIVLENRIKNYFSNLQLPDEPTVYDYLVLSLRSKDYIFSFNWDPLLIQAYKRVYTISKDLPHLLFLHGNVGMGRCDDCGHMQAIDNPYCCHSTNISPSKILFPVKNKDYSNDPYIASAWETFLSVIASCTYLTIFGYSAPKSDIKAVEAMQLAFGSNFRRFDRIEVIDIAKQDKIYNSWAKFFHCTNDHYKVIDTFWDSIFVEFPRRSVEGICKRNILCWAGLSNHQLKKCATFDELAALFRPIIDEEDRDNYDIL